MAYINEEDLFKEEKTIRDYLEDLVSVAREGYKRENYKSVEKQEVKPDPADLKIDEIESVITDKLDKKDWEIKCLKGDKHDFQQQLKFLNKLVLLFFRKSQCNLEMQDLNHFNFILQFDQNDTTANEQELVELKDFILKEIHLAQLNLTDLEKETW